MRWKTETPYTKLIIALILASTFLSCEGQVKTNADEPFQVSHPEAFKNYWYSGEAELNRYQLVQSRYGEERNGDAVLIFVTEDFLPDRQVKKEFGDDMATSILKLNFLKKFVTGIYDYSIMTSVFTPIDYRKFPATMKVTFSSQDWCGQTFSQLNMRDGELNYQTLSYFQNPGDSITKLKATYVEEDIWTRIRIEPQMLPLGSIKMVPSQEYIRLNHKDLEAYQATASLLLQVGDNSGAADNERYIYTLRYPNLDRELKIICQSSFPYKILEWTETLNASNPTEARQTKATLTHTLKNAYWNLNDPKSKALRDSLGLDY